MEKLKQLEQNIIKWADDRGFFGEGGATLFGQYLKLREEFGELSGNFAKGRCMKDDIGDIAVVIIIMNKLSGYNELFTDSFTSKVIETNNFLDVTDLKESYLLVDYAISVLDEDNNNYFENVEKIRYNKAIGLLYGFTDLNNYNFTECLEHAYNEIKDRKGKWINNVFVKESDLSVRCTTSIIEEMLFNWSDIMGREPKEIVLNPCRLKDLKDKNNFRGLKIVALPEVDPEAIYVR